MRKLTIFSIFCLLGITFIFLSCKSSHTIVKEDKLIVNDKYAFEFIQSSSLSPVLDQASAEGKLVFLDVYTSWCLPCRMMDEDVFTHEATADVINENFISYNVDAEKENGPDLATLYGVRSYPTLLFLDPKGRVLERKDGVAYYKEFLALAESARAKYPL